jgi:3-carboxy-cis,cis-muconate cycloisomerase
VGKTTTSANLSAGLALRGKKVAVIDFDVGLRNLDLVMGCERRVVYDFVNVINGEASLNQALIRDKHAPNLFVLPASQTRDKEALTEAGVGKVIDDLKAMSFDYIVCDSPAGIERHRERLQQLKPRVLMGEFGGASGTLSSLEKGAMETQAALMKELGLAQPLISWHTVRDTVAEVGAFLGLVGGSLGKIAMDVKLLMQTEVGEVFEPFAPGRGSSSTMPQKRNPISCLYIHANISVARQHAAALMDAMVADHERSTGPWQIEWVSVSEIFCLMSGALKQTKFVLQGLEVDADRMRANMDMTHGLVMSEAVMMGLGPYLGREYAHDLVYDLCRQALKENRPLIDILEAHPEINQHVDRAQLEYLCNPVHHLGQAGVMVDRVLAARKRG